MLTTICGAGGPAALMDVATAATRQISRWPSGSAPGLHIVRAFRVRPGVAVAQQVAWTDAAPAEAAAAHEVSVGTRVTTSGRVVTNTPNSKKLGA